MDGARCVCGVTIVPAGLTSSLLGRFCSANFIRGRYGTAMYSPRPTAAHMLTRGHSFAAARITFSGDGNDIVAQCGMEPTMLAFVAEPLTIAILPSCAMRTLGATTEP